MNLHVNVHVQPLTALVWRSCAVSREHFFTWAMICPHRVSMLTALATRSCPIACYRCCPAALPPDALSLHSRHTVMLLASVSQQCPPAEGLAAHVIAYSVGSLACEGRACSMYACFCGRARAAPRAACQRHE